MRLLLSLFLAGIALFLLPGLVTAETSEARPAADLSTEAKVNPIPPSEAANAAGKRIYDKSCAMCHGEDGRGEPGMTGMLEVDPPDLTDATWTHGSSDGAVYSIIHNGTETGMEPLSGTLNERQIWTVITFLRSLANIDPDPESTEPELGLQNSTEPESGLQNPVTYSKESVSTGQQQYIRHCVECHGMDGRGHTEMVEFLLERPANLRETDLKYGTKDAGVFRIIREGTPNDMPAFREKLTEEQIWHVVNYLRSIRDKT